MTQTARYAAAGRSTDTTSAVDASYSNLWNNHATISIYVREIHVFQVDATASSHCLQRSSSEGSTPTVTVTPDQDNHFGDRFPPISTTVLFLGDFATDPVIQGPPLFRANTPAAAGAGFIWVFNEPIEVVGGDANGLAVTTPPSGASIGQTSDISYVWDE